jgi:O-antigen/teichoic acid export membrane protein
MFSKWSLRLQKDQHLKELVLGSSTSFLMKMFGMLIMYFVMLYMTNTFGAETFGLYTIALTILSIAVVIPKFGMENSLVRIAGELYTNNKIDTMYSVLKRAIFFGVIVSILVAGALFYTAQDVANLINQPQAGASIKWLSFAIVPTVILAMLAAALQSMRKAVRFLLLSSVLVPLLFLIGMIVLLDQPDIISMYVCCVYLALVFGCAIFLGCLPKTSKEELAYYPFKKVIKISFPMLLSGSFVLIMSLTDILMLSYFQGGASVGVYSAAQKMAGITALSLIAVNAIAAPKYIQFYANRDFKGLETVAKQSTRLIFFTSLPIAIVFLLFPKFILSFLGDEFAVGYMVLVLLTVAQCVNAMSGSVGYILQMTDNQTIFQNVILIAAIFNVVLNYLLIPLYGINGAAFASMVSLIFWNVAMVLYIKSKFGFYITYLPFCNRG